MKLLRRHSRIRLALTAALLLQAVMLATCLTPRADGMRAAMNDMLSTLVMCIPGAESSAPAAPATGDDPVSHNGSACWHCVLVAAFVLAITLTALLLHMIGPPLELGWPWQRATGTWLAPLRLGGLGGRAPPLPV